MRNLKVIDVIIKTQSLLLCFFIFFITACSQLMNQNNLNYETLPLLEATLPTSCRSDSNKVMIGTQNESGVKLFYEQLDHWRRKYSLKEIDEFVLLSLYQFNLRPDSASPTARFQALVFLQGTWKYWDVTESPNFASSLPMEKQQERPFTYPYLHALDQMLKFYKSSFQLNDLARILDVELPNLIPISKGFAAFLEAHSEQLIQNEILQRAYFKGDQPLRAEESISRLSFQRLIRDTRNKFRESNNYQIHHHLFTHESTKARCSFDVNIYEYGVHLVSLLPLVNSNPHVMIGSRGSLYLGISAQRTIIDKTIANSFLLPSTVHTPPSAFCLVPTTAGDLALISSESRDPAQLLKQLLQATEDNKNLNRKEIENLLKSSRALSLYNPDRIVFESQRPILPPVQAKIDSGLPLYHSAKIGDIWAIESRPKEKNNTIYIDRRGQGMILCPSS
jgi:hypothetical protein